MGIIAVIEKAYLQISVADCHRDFWRFLWFDDDFTLMISILQFTALQKVKSFTSKWNYDF